jgi:1,4-alpha-glucan branching enzyme
MNTLGHEFKLYWPHAARVELVAPGQSRATPLRSQGDGWWKVALPLPKGEFRYRFVVDGLYCVPDYAAGEPQYDEDGALISVLQCRG